MTNELLKICSKMIVVLEGGYNTKYLGHHASAVVKALLDQEPGELAAVVGNEGIEAVSDIKASKAKEWAVEDVGMTKRYMKKFWSLK